MKGIRSRIYDVWLPNDYPKFHPFAYSIDLFFPIVDLHQEFYWLPSEDSFGGRPFRGFMWVYIGIGWILTTIGVVGLTGIVKRD